MSIVDRLKSFAADQRKKQFAREKEELDRLKSSNVVAEQQFELRKSLKEERKKAKQYAKNPLREGSSPLGFPPPETKKSDFRSTSIGGAYKEDDDND